jgi:hypothetical protein
MRLMPKEGFGRLGAANNKMEGSKNSPFQYESDRMEQVGGDPERIRLTIVVFVRCGKARFRTDSKP